MSHKVYLHLGSNMGDRLAMLEKAVELIGRDIGPVLRKSPFYETEPWGNTDQPNFINFALLAETELSPGKTLEAIHQIEKDCGRQRLVKWSARILDIDVIFFDDQIIKSKQLTVPHPHMHDRNFVLIPMMDIAEDFIHPVLGMRMDELYDRSPDILEVILLENE